MVADAEAEVVAEIYGRARGVAPNIILERKEVSRGAAKSLREGQIRLRMARGGGAMEGRPLEGQ